MSAHSEVTQLEALRRLIEACKLIDYADCKDETVWQALVGAQGVAEGVVRDYVPESFQKPDGTCKRWCGDGECKEACVSPSAPTVTPVAAQPSEPPQDGPPPKGWYQTLSDLAENTETFGPYSQETARVAIECCMNALEELDFAAPTAAVSAAPSGEVVEALHELALLMSDTIRGEYEPDSFTLQPAVHALAAVGIEFPDDEYLLTQRESCIVVPVKPSAAMLKAMAESRAVDDEGEFPAMLDLLDFSGENKTRTALEAAYVAAITATKE